jgi:threonyl-tRNA synthetase
LFRVRTFTQDDAHIFCTPEQIQDEVKSVLALAQRLYKRFGFTKVRMALATRPEKAIGDDSLWEKATKALGEAMDASGFAYSVDEGGGAFYGPKIDIMIEDAMGREWQCGTVQIDFFLPQRFELSYVASDQSRQQPVMIHRALYGSLERFMGILIEHYKGHLPFWIAPEQVRVLTITDDQADYAQKVYDELFAASLRVSVDSGSDKINAKIKRAQLAKIPWMLVLGDKEKENGTVTLRHVTGKQEFGLTMAQLREKWEELLSE